MYGGGVLTFIKTSYKPRNLQTYQSVAKVNGLEITLAEVSFTKSKKPTIIVGEYRPPNAKSDWFDLFNNTITNISSRGRLIIMGDLNSDLQRPKTYPGKI